LDIVSPESVGLSSARLARVSQAMSRYVEQGKVAGVVTLIARHSQIAHFEACGVMDLEARQPMPLDAIFRIYSQTKPITSAAVMMLYEDGCFHLTDPVSRFIPGFEQAKVFVRETESGVELADLEREITIRDLLTHTSGLIYGAPEGSYLNTLYRERIWGLRERRPDLSLQEMVQEITHLPLAFQPGSAWRYGLSADVLGYLVEVVSGMPFEAFLQQRIFGPLGMVDTGFYVPADKLDRFPAAYELAEGGGIELNDDPRTSRFTKPPRNPSGGAGLVSTTMDSLRFAQMMLNRGELDGVRLLGRKTVELMTMNHLPAGMHPFAHPWWGFGLGVAVLIDLAPYQALGSLGTYEWGGLPSNEFWVDPQESLIGVLMVQIIPDDAYPIQNDFRTMTYQAIVD